MSNGGSEGTLLRDPRLAPLATREWPAWLWSADGSRILWANATGAAIFGADTSRACSERRFHVSDLAAAQVIRLAATLPAGEQERLERLRGFARAHRSRRGGGAHRRYRSGGSGAAARRARAAVVGGQRAADRGFFARWPLPLCQYRGRAVVWRYRQPRCTRAGQDRYACAARRHRQGDRAASRP